MSNLDNKSAYSGNKSANYDRNNADTSLFSILKKDMKDDESCSNRPSSAMRVHFSIDYGS